MSTETAVKEQAPKLKKKKERDPSKLGVGRMVTWNARAASTAINNLVIGSYILVYCTQALHLRPGTVSIILMCCKIFDGFTDLVAGFIVDNTNTKWGRGRPYEWCVIGLWLCTWLMYSTPAGWGNVAKYVWITIFYVLSTSIFTTFLNANGTVYMIRAFHNEQAYVKLSSWGGIFVTACVIVFNFIMPSYQAKIIDSPTGWSHLIGIVALPLALIGILRFFFIKEEVDLDIKTAEKVTWSDVVTLLKTNKYIYVVALLLLLSTAGGSISVSYYYFIYIVQDLSIMGVMSLLGIIAMASMVLYPLLLKKISVVNMMRIFLLLYIPYGFIAWFAKANMTMLIIAGILSGLAALPVSYMSALLLVDMADYNEWKGIKRMEGCVGCVTGFSNKVGAALGTFILGQLLEIGKFSTEANAIQPDSAIFMIRFIYAWIPVIFGILMLVVLSFWKLDKQKPQMEKELAAARAARGEGEAAVEAAVSASDEKVDMDDVKETLE